MFDATLAAAERASGRSSILARLGLEPGSYAVATLHRAENTDDPGRLAALVNWLKAEAAGAPIVFPLHPRTRGALAAARLGLDPLLACEPLGYLDMHQLLAGCRAVFTDSGGLQKEAYFHGKPCVTLREETEWVETIENGWNRLWTEPAYRPRRPIPDYGDGRAALRVAEILAAAAGG
jgi:UDP-GlcNAc3NAcA epimerase